MEPTYSVIRTREELLLLLPKFSVGAEIGVFAGDFSEQIIAIVEPSLLYLIDPWSGKIFSGDKDGSNGKTLDGQSCYDNLTIKYHNNPKIQLIKDRSKILTQFETDALDWCYIDGDHTYAGVKHDLELCRDKVKKNGIIMGHDYTSPRFKGVVEAVNEFCDKYDLSIKYLTLDKCPSFYIDNIK